MSLARKWRFCIARYTSESAFYIFPIFLKTVNLLILVRRYLCKCSVFMSEGEFITKWLALLKGLNVLNFTEASS
jgi:hypothetical protein